MSTREPEDFEVGFTFLYGGADSVDIIALSWAALSAPANKVALLGAVGLVLGGGAVGLLNVSGSAHDTLDCRKAVLLVELKVALEMGGALFLSNLATNDAKRDSLVRFEPLKVGISIVVEGEANAAEALTGLGF